MRPTCKDQPGAARSEDEVSYLEVWVYQESESTGDVPNIYVHHDLLLPAFPLSLAWVGCEGLGGAPGRNLAAVGTADPGIEIWDLDVADAVEPVVTLGGAPKAHEASVRDEMAVEAAGVDGSDGSKKRKKKRKAKAAAAPASASAGQDALVSLFMLALPGCRQSWDFIDLTLLIVAILNLLMARLDARQIFASLLVRSLCGLAPERALMLMTQ